ncbi:MAG: hypothetical protein WCI72_04665 [archaeon]
MTNETQRRNFWNTLDSSLVNFNDFCEQATIGTFTFPLQVATGNYTAKPNTRGGQIGQYVGNTVSTLLTSAIAIGATIGAYALAKGDF